jgi:hypothetical protein
MNIRSAVRFWSLRVFGFARPLHLRKRPRVVEVGEQCVAERGDTITYGDPRTWPEQRHGCRGDRSAARWTDVLLGDAPGDLAAAAACGRWARHGHTADAGDSSHGGQSCAATNTATISASGG